MSEIIAKLRWYPGDSLTAIRETDLHVLSLKHGVTASLEAIRGKNCYEEGGILREETMSSTIEEVTQTVVTVSSEDESKFRSCITDIILRYRAPRTIFALMGSNERGTQIVREVAEVDDGWM